MGSKRLRIRHDHCGELSCVHGIVDLSLCVRIGWVDETGDGFGSRYQLVKQLQTFLLGCDYQLGDARDVATRTAEAGSEADLGRCGGGFSASSQGMTLS